MRRPTVSTLSRRPRQWRHQRATALSPAAHEFSVSTGHAPIAWTLLFCFLAIPSLLSLQRLQIHFQVTNQQTKIDGKSGKVGNSKKVSNRILPKALVGIYRNGAAGKIIKKSQTKEPLNDINNARLQGNVYKLLNNCDSELEPITIENGTKGVSKNPLFDSAVKNILHPTPPGDKRLSPVLGKVDGKKQRPKIRCIENVNPPRVFNFLLKPKNKNSVNIEKFPDSAIKKYEELCSTVSAENFEGKNLPQFVTDPLIATKKKLRSMYAESFRSQYLGDTIKRGTVLNEVIASSSKDNPSDVEYCSLGYVQDSDLGSVAVEKPDRQLRHRKDKRESLPESENIFVIPEKHFDLNGRKNEAPPNLLFDLSLLNKSSSGVENVEPESLNEMNNLKSNLTDITINNRDFYEGNYCKRDSNFKAAASMHVNKMERLKEKMESPLFIPKEAQLPNDLITKKHLKRKIQRVQTQFVKHGAKKHPGRGNLKVSHQVKNLKHIPAILRRCNNAANNNNRLNLFDPSMHINKKPQEILLDVAPKQSALFSPQTLDTESNRNSKKLETTAMFDPADVQTCVMASPSLLRDEVCFKSFREQPVDAKQQPQKLKTNEIFLGKKNMNPSVQKTIMFTKKDSRNIGHCLYLNNLITDRSADNSNVCVMRRSVSVDQEKSMKNPCPTRRNCQQCHRCSEGSDGSYYCSQESNPSQMQNAEVHQKPVVCEKVLLRRVQQHLHSNQKCHNDQHVCYVVVDPNSVQECSSDNVSCQKEKHRTVHPRHFYQDDVSDIGILKGVQNLQILPMEERELQTNFTSNQCTGRNAVVIEEQPIKYLAVENNSRAQKIPIYMQSNKRVTSVDKVEVVNPNVGYRVVSCPKESSQKVIFVPTCEQSKAVYGKQENLASYDESPLARKVILCRPEFQSNLWYVKDPSNVCEVHVPKQNLMEVRNTKCDTVVNNLQGDKVKLSRRSTVNWDDLHYRSNHEYQHVNDGCVRNHTIFYKK
ncbi:uncharacterized protein LOC117606568 isoform X1 [Osmia lignaria lignaria]|uniref:uncharacterized protein LOC117606568 isoform X1 n=1 Tax=Osmia lignaria lignaria TaxID=1437193 RepID=UPI00402B3DBE